jgi:hypothetical protein
MVEPLVVDKDDDIQYGDQFGIVRTLSAGTNDTPIFRPKQITRITVGLYPTAGSGKVQTTTSTKALIDADTAEWIDWPDGTVTSATHRRLEGVYTAFRLVRVTGTVKMEARG